MCRGGVKIQMQVQAVHLLCTSAQVQSEVVHRCRCAAGCKCMGAVEGGRYRYRCRCRCRCTCVVQRWCRCDASKVVQER